MHFHTRVLQVDLLLKQHQGMLKALYSRYRLKPSGGGLRPKVLKLDGWLALMSVRVLVRALLPTALCAVTGLIACACVNRPARGVPTVVGTVLNDQPNNELCQSLVDLADPCHVLTSFLVHCLVQDARLIDSQFTLVDATLSFLWSRMFVIDEIKDYIRCGCWHTA
jgi:hypothetical protein